MYVYAILIQKYSHKDESAGIYIYIYIYMYIYVCICYIDTEVFTQGCHRSYIYIYMRCNLQFLNTTLIHQTSNRNVIVCVYTQSMLYVYFPMYV